MSRASASYAAPRAGFTIDPWVIIAFLYPLTQVIMVEFGGQLYLTDLAGMALLLYALQLPDFRQRLLQIRVVLFFLALWFIGQVLTDLYRETPIEDLARGWAKILFFGIQIAALWMFLPRKRSYLLAFGMGMALTFPLIVPPQYYEHVWKFGYGDGLMVALACLCCLTLPYIGSMRQYAPVLLALVAAFLLLQNARATFAVSIIAAAVCAIGLVLDRAPNLRRQLTPFTFAILLAIGVSATSALGAVYGATAESGLLGEKALVKYEAQSSGDLPLILGGRSESLVSVIAIQDSPVLGHGSWAKDRKYVEMFRTIRIRLGLNFPKTTYIESDRIPSHSYFFGSWVEAGILGALFWLGIFFMPLTACYYLLKRSEPLMPLIAVISLSLVWSIPFSPFGASARFTASYAIVAMLWFIISARRQHASTAPRPQQPYRAKPTKYQPAE